MRFEQMQSIFPDQQIWGCAIGGFTFVITFDSAGYTASVKHSSEPNRTDLGGYGAHESFNSAEQACFNFYKQHRN